MISSETKILLKRSGIPGRIPSLADLKLGELGINYYDGKIFFRQENEVVGSRIIEPGQGDAIGKTIFVTVLGNDNNSGLNERDAKRSIKAAAAIAEPGDSIKVYPGQYIEDNPITFKDRVSVEGMELRNVLVTPANPGEDLYLVGDGFHATNHSFVSNQDSTDAAAIISFRRLEGTASDRYFDAARLIRDNLDFISGETVGFLTSGYSGFAAGQRSHDGARSIELNKDFITEEAFQYINSPDYRGPGYFNPDINQCRSDLGDILDGWRYDLISDGNSETTGVGLTYYAPVPFTNTADITDILYDNETGNLVLETEFPTFIEPGDEIKLQDIRFDCGPYGNEFFIADFKYDNESGIGTVTLPFIHDIIPGDTVKLDKLKFDCPPYGAEEFSVVDFTYEETTGASLVTLNREHSLSSGDTIELRNLQFDCPTYGGQFTNVTGFDYNEVTGNATVYFADSIDLSSGDFIQLYDIKFSCPPYGNAISITEFTYDNVTGISEATLAKPHGLQPGDTVKFEDLKFSCSSYLDLTYGIVSFDYNNLTGSSLLTLTGNHSFSTGDVVQLENLIFECNSYVPFGKDVSSFSYDNNNGVSIITLHEEHNLQIGDSFRLENLSFECNSYPTSSLPVQNATYDNVTGFVTLQFASDHGQEVGQKIRLSDLEYSCVNSGITTTLFPDGTFGFEFEILSVPSSSSIIVNVGTSTIQHTYVGGGTATVGLTTTVFPDGTQGFDFIVNDIIDGKTLVSNVGVSTIVHSYVGGGQLFVGFTTTVFPDGTQGFDYTVTNVPATDQIEINVGVSSIIHTYVSGGTVSTEDNFINVTNLEYDATSGVGTITLPTEHNLVTGDSFILEDLKFTCDSYRAGAASSIAISDFQYDETTGQSTITVVSPHNLINGDTVALYDIQFTCDSNPPGITTTIFPDGTRENFYPVLATPDPNTIITNVGTSTIPHTYDNGGVMQVGITTNIFPDGTRPSDNFFHVISTPASNVVVTNIGVSSIAHTYASGGRFYSGITTNVFPQVFQDPNVNVVDSDYNNLTGIIEITCDVPHGLMEGDPVLLQDLEFSCLSGGPNNTPGSLVFPRNQEVYNVPVGGIISPTVYRLDVGTSDFPHTYVSGGKSTPQNIRNAVYNNLTGELTVTTTKQHGFRKGDSASVVDLIFTCPNENRSLPDGSLLFPRPKDEFVVLASGVNQFTLNVGPFPGLVHTWIGGGSANYQGATSPITAAVYDEATGELVVTTRDNLEVAVDTTITIQGLEFACLSGGPGNNPGSIIFPRLDVPFFPVTDVVDAVTYVINVGTSTIIHDYVSGGFSSLRKKENDNNVFRVIGVPTPDKLVVQVPPISIPHDYVGGGNAFTGITTNIFPDGTRDDGFTFEVLTPQLDSNSAVIKVGISSIPHVYESGGRLQYGETNERKVIDFQYTNTSGLSTVIVRGSHGLNAGDNVKLQGLEFECVDSPGITTSIFPDGTAGSLNIYRVDRILNNNTFECNVGQVNFTHTYLRGGSAFTGITTNIFPDGTQGFEFTVNNVVSPTQVSLNVGISSITHEYIRGGSLFSGNTNEREIADFDYDGDTGRAILTFRELEDSLQTGNLVKLVGLEFNCPNGSGITTNIFPDGSIGNLFPVTRVLNQTQVELNIATSDIPHTWIPGTGSAFVGITTDIFPDIGIAPGQQPSKLFKVVGVPTPNKISVNVGASTIPHSYVSGGSVSIGINTDTFPGDNIVSPLGDIFIVDAVSKSGELIINVGTSSITHEYVPGWSGGQVLFGESAGGELQHITGPGVSEATIAAIDFERQISQYAINNRPWGSFIAAETGRITQFQYANFTGMATVTSPGINAQVGDMMRMSDVEFRCSDEYAGLTTTIFPDNTRPEGQYFTVDKRIDDDTFETFIGISTIQHLLYGGGSVYRYRQSINNIDYNNVNGITSVSIPSHGFVVGDYVELGDIRFTCNSFAPDYDIEDFQYDNSTGLSTVTTTLDNDIEVGDLVKLADIQLKCPPYGNEISISDFDYDNLTGLTVIETEQPHGIALNPREIIGIQTASYDGASGLLSVVTEAPINFRDIKEKGVVFAGLAFTCTNSTTETNVIDAVYDGETGIVRITTNVLNNAVVGSKVKLEELVFECSSGGVPSQQVFPSGVDGFDFIVTNVISPLEFEADVGKNDIDHTYISGGSAKVGITTNIYPEKDTIYKVTEVRGPSEFDAFVGTSPIDHIYQGGGTATQVDRSDIKLSNIKLDCPPYGNDINITNFLYDNTTGQSLITVERDHDLVLGETIKLADIKFQCPPYGNDFNVIAAGYANTTGILTITTATPFTDLSVGDSIRVQDLQFDCNDSGVQFSVDAVDFSINSKIVEFRLLEQPVGLAIGDAFKVTDLKYRVAGDSGFPRQYPDGRDASLNQYVCNNIRSQAGPGVTFWFVEAVFPLLTEADVIFEQGQGELTVGVTTNIYPETTNLEGGIYEVLALPSENQVTIEVGISTVEHTYIRNGEVFVGVTTNFFPGSPQNSPKGNLFPVIDIPASNQIRINVGVSSIPHTYDSGGSLLVGITTNIFPDSDPQNSPLGDIFQVLQIVDTNTVVVNVGTSTIPHNYVSGGEMSVGITTNIFPGSERNSPGGDIFKVLSKDEMCPDRFTVNVGPSSIPHTYVQGGTVTTGVTTNRFPDGTNGFEFEVLNVLDQDNFLVNVGPSSIQHQYASGGFARRLETQVNSFDYDNTTGVATIGLTKHRMNIGDLVKLRDIKFDCDAYGGEKLISDVDYNNNIGSLLVTTDQPHGLVINEDVKLSGIQMDCPIFDNNIVVVNGVYNNTNGLLQLQLQKAHNLSITDNVKLAGLEFICPGGSGITTNIFPDGTAPSYNIFPIESIDGSTTLTIRVGVSSIVHNYVPGTGYLFVGITTNIFPGSKQNSPKGSIYPVLDIPTTNSFVVRVGTSTIPHNYIRGGMVQAGVTTDMFPDGTQGDFFIVEDVLDENTIEVNTGISSITHRYNSGGYGSKYSTYQSKNPQVLDERVIRVSGDCKAVEARVEQLAGIVTSIIENGPSAAPGDEPVKVTEASYNGITGNLSITVNQPISISTNDVVKVQNLLFQCNKSSTVSEAYYDNRTGVTRIVTGQPHGLEVAGGVLLEGLLFACNDGSLVYPSEPEKPFAVARIIDKFAFELDLETSLKIHTYVSGGTCVSVPTSRIFPDNKVLNYRVRSVLSPTTFTINVGPNTIDHTYVSGGTVNPGLRFEVSDASFNNITGEVTITTADRNYFVENTGVQLNNLLFQCPSGGPNNAPGILPFPDGRPANVVDSTYDNVTGVLRVITEKPHQLYRDAKVILEGLQFSCSEGSSVYPISGPSGIVEAQYNNFTGLLRITTDSAHGFNTNSRVRLQNMKFSCKDGETEYPVDSSLVFPVVSVESSVAYTVQLRTSTLTHTYLGGGTSSNAINTPLRVTKVEDDYTYEVLLEPSDLVHTYVQGGTSDPGIGNYRIDKVLSEKTFTVRMAPNNISHTYISGGTAAAVFTQQEFENINLRTDKCAEDVRKIYLAVVHDASRGGNMKSVAAARLYRDAVGQFQHIAGGEVNQTIAALDYSLNIVRCVINNVSWGGVPRGFFTKQEIKNLVLPKSTQTSVVKFARPAEKGQFTTEKKFIENMNYDNITGIATIKTKGSHLLTKYDAIKLADIQMRCVGSPRITTNIFPDGTQGEIFEVLEVLDDNPIYAIGSADYDNTTGRLVIGNVGTDFDIPVGSFANLRNLRFECSSSGLPGIAIYPEDPKTIFEVIERPASDLVVLNVGISTIAHTFIPITTGIDFPQIQELPTSFTAHVGRVNFPHIYESGGTVWRRDPFSNPLVATQLRDVSIQDDPLQLTNSTPNACANVFSAIENAVGVVTTIIDLGFEEAGIPIRYPGNDGKGVDTIGEMSSQGVGNIIKGPYIRNCTNFVPKSIGMRMDGFDAEPGDEISNGVQGSSNVDSFTQFNPGGIGCSISNGTYQQLVSIFTICCDEAITCDSGAQLDLTNSNSSFGRLGLVARGIGDANSKCIDRYTGIVAEEAIIEDDVVIIAGVGLKRPYDGQGIFFGELFREVVSITVVDGGSGYDDRNPPFAFVDEPTGPSGIKAEVSPTVINGVVTSVEVISNGNQYRNPSPTISIDPPKDPNGRQAKAITVTEPLYYDVESASEPSEGTVRVVFKQRLNNTVSIGTTVFFSRLSLQIASSHSFEYIGAGNEIDGARPSQGGVPIKENEVVKENGGQIVYTSTDQAGNFNIGDEFVINQFTGTVTGRSFDQSVLNKVTPLIIALDS